VNSSDVPLRQFVHRVELNPCWSSHWFGAMKLTARSALTSNEVYGSTCFTHSFGRLQIAGNGVAGLCLRTYWPSVAVSS
jgi:hypothetical protein